MLRCPDPEHLICEKLLEMIETQPFYKIYVTDLCKYAQISRGSFYTYFDSIYSVMQKIEDDFFQGLIEEDRMTFNNLTDSSENRMAESLMRSTAEYLKKVCVFTSS